MDPGRDKIALPINSEERNLEKHQPQKKKKEKNRHNYLDFHQRLSLLKKSPKKKKPHTCDP